MTTTSRPRQEEHGFRHAVLILIHQHLLPAQPDRRARWHGHQFNFSRVVFNDAIFQAIDVPAGTVINCTYASFPAGTVDFSYTTFSGGNIDFYGADVLRRYG